MAERNLVSCRNINIIAQYVKEQLGSDAMLFVDLEHSAEYFKNEHHWITLSLYNAIMDRAIELLKDPNAPYKMGFSALASGSWGLFRYVQLIFLAVMHGPAEVYKRVGEYNTHFNSTKDLSIRGLQEGRCLMRVQFKNGIEAVDDYHSEMFIKGLWASIPLNWNLKAATVETYTKEYRLDELLQRIGGTHPGEMKLKGGSFFFRNKEIGKKVRLLDPTGDSPTFAGYADIEGGAELERRDIGIVITKETEVNERLTLKEGEIYNAPFFLYRITWEPLTITRKVKHIFMHTLGSKRAYLEGMESSLATIRHYVETLEEKVVERTRQLNTAKSEAEYWRDKANQLLSTMLPPDIVKAMLEGRLKAQEVQGTVMYTDLADFTAYSKSIPPAVIEKQLTEYFTEMCEILVRHGGWVNKFLGDGILVIFGLDSDPNAVCAAADAALEMDHVITKYPWRTRVGIATGPFVTGEFGSDSLRRFDCIGHTMNLGSRLQGLADSGQVLVCAESHARLEKKGYGLSPARMVYAKGIGDILAYPLVASPKLKKRVSKRAPRVKKQSA